MKNSFNLVLLIVLFVFVPRIIFAQTEPFIIVLGTAQDGGYPQAGCKKQYCKKAWKDEKLKRFVSCLALVEPSQNRAWLFDATPDFKEQLQLLKQQTNDSIQLAGIFLTHAHIGHYTGLMNLGREVMGTQNIPVYAMPRMKNFIETNGPWSLMVKLKNLKLNDFYLLDSARSDKLEMKNYQPVILSDEISVTPFLVPHRDEFSETVGYKILFKKTTALFIPDIDKWEKWDHKIVDEVSKVNFAFIDATFFDENELGAGRMKDIPHPFVTETMKLFENSSEKNKIQFIHLNHTNPLLDKSSREYEMVIKKGFRIAEQGRKYF